MVTKGHALPAYVRTDAAGGRKIYISTIGEGNSDEVVPISRGEDAPVRTSKTGADVSVE